MFSGCFILRARGVRKARVSIFFVQPLPRKAATVVQKGDYRNFVCDAQEGSCHKLGYAPPKTPFEKGYSLLYVVGSCIIMSALFCFISDTAKVTRGIKSFGRSCAIEWSLSSILHAGAMGLIPLGNQATISFH